MMAVRLPVFVRAALLIAVLGIAAVSIDAQGRAVRTSPVGVVRGVQVALGHGDVAGATRIAESGQGDAAAHGLARALVALFEGRDADARTLLTPLAAANPLGDASLELGLLDLRTGRRQDAQTRLYRLASVRTFNTPDDYVRLARAAEGTREFPLANDAFNRIANERRADIQTLWGDMFLTRHRPGDAATNYWKALTIDPQWVPAMVGLARAFEDVDGVDVSSATTLKTPEEALDAARKQAPEYPDLFLITAETALGNDDVAGAKAALDHLAKVKPGTIDEAALRAAVAYKESGVSAVDAAAAHVHDVDPASAQAYRAASEEATHSYHFDDAVALAEHATSIDADDPEAHFDLGLARLRTGDEAGARTELERSWSLDNSSRLTKILLDLLDHLDTFEVIPHNNFIFKFAKNEAPVLKLYAIPLADEAYRQYVERYGFTPKGPILVEVFPTHDDFAVRTLGLPGLVGALGSCFGTVVSMDSPSARPPGDFSWQATLWHELAHVFTLQLSDYRVPRWLTEGMSAYEEHRRNPAWGRELSLEFAARLNKDDSFDLKKLADAFRTPDIALAYFEASLVVEHLEDEHGVAGLRTLLLAYAGGATDEQAFEKAYGENITAVEASFRTFMIQKYGSLRDAMKDPPKEVADTDMAGLAARAASAPGNFESQLAYGQALVRAGDLAGARAPLERAAALAPEASGEGSPHGLLARIAEDENDNTRAIHEWRALLLWDHQDIDAARKLAVLSIKAKAPEDEIYAERLVTDLDPFDAEAHVTLGRALLAKGDATGALLEFQANIALGPANPAEAHSDLAEAFIKTNRMDEARREALAALRVAPSYARAQDLLLEATGK